MLDHNPVPSTMEDGSVHLSSGDEAKAALERGENAREEEEEEEEEGGGESGDKASIPRRGIPHDGNSSSTPNE